jgi:hypothetical protein
MRGTKHPLRLWRPGTRKASRPPQHANFQHAWAPHHGDPGRTDTDNVKVPLSTSKIKKPFTLPSGGQVPEKDVCRLPLDERAFTASRNVCP